MKRMGKNVRAGQPALEQLESRLLLDGSPLAGDLNSDGRVNAADIDLLNAAIHSPSPSPANDLNGDGNVDNADFQYLISNLIGTKIGDANLDGRVDGADFQALARQLANCRGRHVEHRRL